MSEDKDAPKASEEEAPSSALVPSPEIVQRLEPYVIPELMNEAAGVVSMMIEQRHSGPLPAAQEFANYDRALPGAAERILVMAEKEQSHLTIHR